MDRAAEIFGSHQPRLFGIAYRMLRTRADAEDVLQDAYLRWHEAAGKDIRSPVAFLITITTRLCVDRIRDRKKEREQCTRPELPHRIAQECVPSPEARLEIADEVSVAFLAVLERLGAGERAAFLLHEVFDYDYPEVAQMIGKSEAACRQLVHRALLRVSEAGPRFVVSAESWERLLAKFLAAVRTGDRETLMSLLAEKVEHTLDGGSKLRRN